MVPYEIILLVLMLYQTCFKQWNRWEANRFQRNVEFLSWI